MSFTESSKKKTALYYPYIHIRSEHWLKATLLYSPAVARIVPTAYSPEDEAPIARYAEIKGASGTLLQAVPAWSPAADAAQQRLLRRIEGSLDVIQQNYGQARAPVPDKYWIHEAKFNGNLLNFLKDHDLAWPSQNAGGYGHRTWFALHPILGSAIMTTLGLSIASEQQYDIVTNSDEFHETLLTNAEDQIFDTLLRLEGDEKVAVNRSQAPHRLGQRIIMLAGINLQALRPEDIPALHESPQFETFRKALRARTRALGLSEEPGEAADAIEEEAQEIVDAWQAMKGSIGKTLRNGLFGIAEGAAVNMLKDYLKNSPPVATDYYIAAGIAIGHVGYATWRSHKERKESPYSYLTTVADAERPLLQLSFPLGLER